jgi:hypothetical protein
LDFIFEIDGTEITYKLKQEHIGSDGLTDPW